MEEQTTSNPDTSTKEETLENEKVLLERKLHCQNSKKTMAKNEPDLKPIYAASDRSGERMSGVSRNGAQMNKENLDDEQELSPANECPQEVSLYKDMTTLHREKNQGKFDQQWKESKDDIKLNSEKGKHSRPEKNVQENLKDCKKTIVTTNEKVHMQSNKSCSTGPEEFRIYIVSGNEIVNIRPDVFTHGITKVGPSRLDKIELFSLNINVTIIIDVCVISFEHELINLNGNSEDIVLEILGSPWMRRPMLENEPFRYATFSRSNGSTEGVSIMDLARNGFFYDIDHHVRCYFCGAVFNVQAPVAVVHDQNCQAYENMGESFADYGTSAPDAPLSNSGPSDVLSAVTFRSEDGSLIQAEYSGCTRHNTPVVQESHPEEADGRLESCTSNTVDYIPDPDIVNHQSSGSQPSEEFSMASLMPTEETPARHGERGNWTNPVAVEARCHSDITRTNVTGTRELFREETHVSSASLEYGTENEEPSGETLVTKSQATLKSSSATNHEIHEESSTNRSAVDSASSSESNLSGTEYYASNSLDVHTKYEKMSPENNSNKDDTHTRVPSFNRCTGGSKVNGNNCDTRESRTMSTSSKRAKTNVEKPAKNLATNEKDATRPVNTEYAGKTTGERKVHSKSTVVPISGPTYVPTRDQSNNNSKSSEDGLATACSQDTSSEAMKSHRALSVLGSCTTKGHTAYQKAEMSPRANLDNALGSSQHPNCTTSGTANTSNSRIQNPDTGFSSFDKRIESFQQCKQFEQTPQEMACAGQYYTGNGNYTMCYQCGGRIHDWEPGDNPVAKHKEKFPSCLLSKRDDLNEN